MRVTYMTNPSDEILLSKKLNKMGKKYGVMEELWVGFLHSDKQCVVEFCHPTHNVLKIGSVWGRIVLTLG